GQRMGSLYGPGFIRVPTGALKGMPIIGTNGIAEITPTSIYLGNINPDWIAGITNRFSYKGIYLECLFDMDHGGVMVSRFINKAIGAGQLIETAGARLKHAPGDVYNTDYYRDGGVDNGNGTYTRNLQVFDGSYSKGVYGTGPRDFYKHYYDHNSEQQLVDRSFVKLREAKIGYSIPKRFYGRAPIQSISFSLVGRNLAGCTKNFESINTNPNSPQTVESEQFLLPAIIKNAVRNYAYAAQFQAATCGDYYANQYTSQFSDAWTASQTENGFLWNFFDQLKDEEDYRLLARQKGDKNNEGVALVLRCWMFQVMTDNFGDMPYTQAVQGKTDNDFAPVYDSQETIYYALLDSLKQANTLLATGTDPINADILMNGSAMRWREFANGLRVRLLMRMSNVANAKVNVGTEITSMVSDPSTYPFFASNADQAALEFT